MFYCMLYFTCDRPLQLLIICVKLYVFGVYWLQLNCVEYSSLCTDQKITQLPTHLLYKSGQKVCYCRNTTQFDCMCQFEGVSNTVTHLRLLGSVFLEFHYWANRVKYCQISKMWRGFSLKLFVRTGRTSDFVLKQTKRGVSPWNLALLAPRNWWRRRQAPPRLRPRRVCSVNYL